MRVASGARCRGRVVAPGGVIKLVRSAATSMTSGRSMPADPHEMRARSPEISRDRLERPLDQRSITARSRCARTARRSHESYSRRAHSGRRCRRRYGDVGASRWVERAPSGAPAPRHAIKLCYYYVSIGFCAPIGRIVIRWSQIGRTPRQCVRLSYMDVELGTDLGFTAFDATRAVGRRFNLPVGPPIDLYSWRASRAEAVFGGHKAPKTL